MAQKEARDWECQKGTSRLVSITTLQPPAPNSIMKLISCKCKKGCRGPCCCRKAGLICCILCVYYGGACDNGCQQGQDEEGEALGKRDLLQEMVDEDLCQPPTIVEYLSGPQEPDDPIPTAAEEVPEIKKLPAEEDEQDEEEEPEESKDHKICTTSKHRRFQ